MDIELKLKKMLIKAMLGAGRSIPEISKETGLHIRVVNKIIPKFGFTSTSDSAKSLGMIDKKGCGRTTSFESFYKNNFDNIKQLYPDCPSFEKIKILRYIPTECLNAIKSLHNTKRRIHYGISCPDGYITIANAAKSLGVIDKRGNGAPYHFEKIYGNNFSEIKKLYPDCPSPDELREVRCISKECLEAVGSLYTRKSYKKKRKNPRPASSNSNIIGFTALGIAGYLAYRIYRW